MQEKYRKICQILNIPTHGIHVTNIADEYGIPMHVTYELNDVSVLTNILQTLNKELKMNEEFKLPTHLFKVYFEKEGESIKMKIMEGTSEDKIRADFESRGYSNIQIYKAELGE
jgi:hypothetical protein